MPRINVVKPFSHTSSDPTLEQRTRHYPVGVHDVPDDVAGHWFTKAHCVDIGADDTAALSAPAHGRLIELEDQLRDATARGNQARADLELKTTQYDELNASYQTALEDVLALRTRVGELEALVSEPSEDAQDPTGGDEASDGAGGEAAPAAPLPGSRAARRAARNHQ